MRARLEDGDGRCRLLGIRCGPELDATRSQRTPGCASPTKVHIGTYPGQVVRGLKMTVVGGPALIWVRVGIANLLGVFGDRNGLSCAAAQVGQVVRGLKMTVVGGPALMWVRVGITILLVVKDTRAAF